MRPLRDVYRELAVDTCRRMLRGEISRAEALTLIRVYQREAIGAPEDVFAQTAGSVELTTYVEGEA